MFKREADTQAQGLSSIWNSCHTLLTDVSRESPSCDFLTLGAARGVLRCHTPWYATNPHTCLLFNFFKLRFDPRLTPTYLPRSHSSP